MLCKRKYNGMTQEWQDPVPAVIGSGESNNPVLGLSGMPLETFTHGQHTVIVTTEDGFTPSDFYDAVIHINGDWDWWYGEISPGIYAYSIVTEDADGNTGNPDWPGLPELFKSDIMAGLRRTLPFGESS